jgi:hypothetical protein
MLPFLFPGVLFGSLIGKKRKSRTKSEEQRSATHDEVRKDGLYTKWSCGMIGVRRRKRAEDQQTSIRTFKNIN